ncbi:MAG: GNAT family N-acetyltransferase [Proteobacteria bacterium]|nr:GNAT family N-acetyltransferase [Pseudomonadota bacterium]
MTGPEAARGESPVLRESIGGDLAAIQAIYGHHVLNGFGSFELAAPDFEEIASRRDMVIGLGLPYVVAEWRGRVAGFAYAGPFRPRPAYRYTVEDSIYVAPDATGCGLGSALLAALIARCETLDYRQMVAVIGGGEARNAGSVRLHARHGFRMAGQFEGIGYKSGSWVDSIIMQRALGPGAMEAPGPRV